MSNVSYNAVFSTVEDYYTSVMKEQQKKGFEWPKHQSDFFPYYQNSFTHIWAGYFTSRSNFKQSIKRFSSIVHATDNYMVLEYLKARNDSGLN